MAIYLYDKVPNDAFAEVLKKEAVYLVYNDGLLDNAKWHTISKYSGPMTFQIRW